MKLKILQIGLAPILGLAACNGGGSIQKFGPAASSIDLEGRNEAEVRSALREFILGLGYSVSDQSWEQITGMQVGNFYGKGAKAWLDGDTFSHPLPTGAEGYHLLGIARVGEDLPWLQVLVASSSKSLSSRVSDSEKEAHLKRLSALSAFVRKNYGRSE